MVQEYLINIFLGILYKHTPPRCYVIPTSHVCPCQIHTKKLVIIFCWNVLIGPPGRLLYQKITNPSKILASVKLMYYIGFN